MTAEVGIGDSLPPLAGGATAGGPPGGEADRLVDSLLSSDPPRIPEAVELLRADARRRASGGDRAAAVGCLRRALDLGPPAELRCAVLFELAETEAPLSTEEAIGHYRELRPYVDDASEGVRIRLRIARLLALQLRMTEALDEADQALREADSPGDRLRAELTYISISRQGLQTRPLGRARLEQLRSPAGTSDDPPLLLLGELAYEQALAGVPVDQVVETAMAALGGGTLSALHELSHLTRHVVLLSLVWSGELRTAELAAELVMARARAGGNPIASASAHTILSNVHWHRGQLAKSAEAAGAVIDARVHGYTGTLPGAVGFRAQAIAATGAVEEALAALELPGGNEAWVDSASYHGYLIGRAQVLLGAGDHSGAYEAAMQCGTLASAMGTVNPAVLPWRSQAARAAVALGEHQAARALAEEEVHLARQFGAPVPMALALRSLALTCGPDEAVGLIEEALALYRSTPERLQRAAAQLELAERLAELGREDDARSAAETALAGARELGAGLLETAATAAAERLARTGAPAPAGHRSGAPAPIRDAHQLHVRALGTFCVLDGRDRDVTPGGLAGKAVRVLVAAGRPLHVEELCEELWPDGSDPDQSRARLPNVISRSRVPGFGSLLVRRGEMISLAPEVVVDADTFEEQADRVLKDGAGEEMLHDALTVSVLYGGDLLPSDPYADWTVLRREHLRMRYLAVTDLAGRLAEEAGQLDTAVNLVEAAIRHDPYDEDRYHRAAALLERSGRTSAARQMAERAERVRKALEL